MAEQTGGARRLVEVSAALLLLAAIVAGSLWLSERSGDRALSEWPVHGLTSDEQRYSGLTQVNRDTVSRLGLVWYAQFDTDRGLESTPIMTGGVLYTTTAWSKVHAFDARTGRKLWSFDPKVPGQKGLHACCDVNNRGAAVADGRVFVGALDGRLIALDAKTGKPIWQTQTFDPARPYTITGAPKVIRDKVVIGNGGAEYGVRGYVTAYDTRTGKLAWRFYLAPNPRRAPDNAASDEPFARFANATWGDGAWQQVGGGGTAWDSLTYDEKNDLLLIGAGNGGPWNGEIRSGGKGDDLFLSSIVAVRPDTGKYVWHYQTTPGDEWDYTATQHIMLAELEIEGKPRRVVMQAPKNGFFYVLDAATGKLISADKYIPLDWAERVDPATGRPVLTQRALYGKAKGEVLNPGPLGGHNWHPMAYSPQTGLVYIPALGGTGYYQQQSTPFRPIDGIANRGVTGLSGNYSLAPKVDSMRDAAHYGELIAWDPVARKSRWRLRFDEYYRSGVLATAGGLVFHSVGRNFTAFDAANGKVLWQYDTSARAIAPAITYRLDGRQYVALMVGWGGVIGMSTNSRNPGRLMVFALDGKARAPAFPDTVIPPPLDLSQAEPSTGDATAGSAAFMTYCVQCHRSGVYLPNLSRTPVILNSDALAGVVLDGALSSRGMPSFKTMIDRKTLEDLRAYFLAQAKAGATGQPAKAGTPGGGPVVEH